ncbi:MAG TPA: energy transducer TonB [Bacteroidia bacterium]|jgi:protein TonB|nr:energy transducer TonB [Bacteroidia bacterium]
MKIVFNNSQKLNDIVFANRNKDYGAYALRAAYNSTIFKSLSIVSSTVFLFAIGVYIFSKVIEEKKEIYLGTNDSIVTIFDGHPDVDKPKDLPKKQGGGAKTNAIATVINDTASVDKKPDLDPNANPNPNGDPTNTGTLTGTGTGSIATTATVAEIPESPTAFPAENPEFEGGLKALYDFIGKNTVYPNSAREIGKEGTVFVTFIIDENGQVESAKILKGIGAGCDEEATRVINKLPKFKKPGKNTLGKPVKTIFNIPFVFKLK